MVAENDEICRKIENISYNELSYAYKTDNAIKGEGTYD